MTKWQNDNTTGRHHEMTLKVGKSTNTYIPCWWQLIRVCMLSVAPTNLFSLLWTEKLSRWNSHWRTTRSRFNKLQKYQTGPFWIPKLLHLQIFSSWFWSCWGTSWGPKEISKHIEGGIVGTEQSNKFQLEAVFTVPVKISSLIHPQRCFRKSVLAVLKSKLLCYIREWSILTRRLYKSNLGSTTLLHSKT